MEMFLVKGERGVQKSRDEAQSRYLKNPGEKKSSPGEVEHNPSHHGDRWLIGKGKKDSGKEEAVKRSHEKKRNKNESGRI